MTKNRLTYTLYAYGVCVFIFLIFRALWVPPFPDEILNFHVYVDTGDFLPFTSYPDANNHLISTFFNWISYYLFGANVIWMRWFELLSFLLFFKALIGLREFFKHQIVSTCFVIALSSGFFVLTFFTLARGYGMSMTFLLSALLYLFKAFKATDSRAILISFVFSALTLWSNLSMSISVMLIVLMLCYRTYQIRNKASLTIWFYLNAFFLGLLPIGLAIIYGFYLKAAGALWLGGSTSFYHDIFVNLSYRFLGDKGIWLVGIILLTCLVAFILNFKKIRLHSTIVVITTLFIGTVVGTITLHLLFGVNYPHNRAALHLLLLFLLFVFVLFDQATNWTKYLAAIPASIILIHHLININFSYPSGWKDSTMNKDLYEVLLEQQNNADELLTISAPFYFGEVVHYFNYREPSRLNNVQWIDYPNPIADFIIANPVDKVPNNGKYDTLYSHNTTKVALLENKDKTTWNVLDHKKLRTVSSSDSLLTIGSFYLYLEERKAILTSISTELSCSEKVDFASINVIFFNNVFEEVYNEEIILNQFRNDFTEPQKFEKSLFFTVDPEEYVVEIVLNNPKKYNWKVIRPESWIYKARLD